MADETEFGHQPPTKKQSEKYDQTFFLELAAKGKTLWNEWRRDPANKDMRVTFAGVNFSESPYGQINFSGFEFGDHADFSECKWKCVGLPTSSEFRALFTGAVFGEKANFTGAVFGDWADLNGAIFGNFASFDSAIFGNFTSFIVATFGMCARFDATVFGDSLNFEGAAFGLGATFAGADFKGAIFFLGRSIEGWTLAFQSIMRWMSPNAREELENNHREAWKSDGGSGSDRFCSISFANARFEGKADFSGRSVLFGGNFTNTRFYYPPAFDTVTNAFRIDFTGAQIRFVPPGKRHWTTDSQVPVLLRAMRNFAEETKNHDLERDLYIEERKAERGVYLRQRWEELKKDGWKDWPHNGGRMIAHILWIIIIVAYGAFADYGRSFFWPFVWLVASMWLFHLGYSEILSPVVREAYFVDRDTYERAVWMVTFGNAVPFVGPLTIDAETKKFLFCAGDFSYRCLPIPPEGFQLLVIAQNLVSITLVFFIGLALRNYFKIK